MGKLIHKVSWTVQYALLHTVLIKWNITPPSLMSLDSWWCQGNHNFIINSRTFRTNLFYWIILKDVNQIYESIFEIFNQMIMKIKGWAVFSGCNAKGLGNSWVHRSTWNTLSSAKYFMPSTCCMVLNELWGKKVIYHAKFSKEMQIWIHTQRNTHSLRFYYTHFFHK